jgi:predicted MFS family arabinose efflux permease
MIQAGRFRAASVFVAGFCTFVNLYTPQAFLGIMAADLGSSVTRIGLSITVTLLAVAIMAPVAGAISDRAGRKRLIVGACGGLIVPTLLVAASGDLETLLVWRFVQGLLLPFIFTVTVAYVADECTGPDAIKVSGLYASGTIFGGFSGRFIGGFVADLAGWRAVFEVLAGITALGALFVAWQMPRERQFRPVVGGLGATLRAYGDHLRNGRLLATCALGFGMLFSTVACFTFVNFHLGEAPFNLSPSSLGSVFAVYLLGMVTAPLSTRAAVLVGRRNALMAALVLAACGLALSLSQSLAVVIAGLALVTGGLFVVQALSLGFIGAIVKRARSSAVGLYVTVFYIGGAVGGVAPGWLWHHQGWPGVVAMILAVLAVMAVIGFRAWRPLPEHRV